MLLLVAALLAPAVHAADAPPAATSLADAVTGGKAQLSLRLRYERVDVPVWHEEVTVYEVVRDDERIGRIYLDLHPREGKYKHAAQFTLTDGVAGEQLPEGVLVCNFARGLMEHDHVVTLFHEFGHLLHHVLGGHGDWYRYAEIGRAHV